MRRVQALFLLMAVCPLSCALLPLGQQPGERASYAVYRLAAVPRIDGKVDGDSAWEAIPGVTGFRVLGGDYTAAKQTTAKAGWTSDALFVAMVCEEPDIGLIKDKLKDGEALWKENGVEIFFEIPGRPGVFQFVVNTIGSHAMGEGKVDITKWQAAAVKGKDFWSLEAKIPFSCLGAMVSPGATWHGAFCRNIWEYTSGGDKFTTWPALQGRFREPEHYAVLTFEDRSLSPEEATKIDLGWNASYRECLAKQVKELAKAGPEYAGAIAKACSKKQFKPEATELKTAWQQVAKLSRDPARAPLPELRKLVARAEDLRTRSYDLKYRFLMEELLEE